MGRVNGKIAIVTGSTRGIGEGIARGLAAEGAAVVISGPNVAEGERVAQDIAGKGQEAAFIAADVTRGEDCLHLAQATQERYGRVDVLVNNAGIFPSATLQDTTLELWDDVFAVNVRGAFLCAQCAIPIMQQQGGGVVVNIGSTLAYRGQADRVAYSASKGALLTLTKTLAQVYAKDRIRVNWVTVGWVETPGELELRNAIHADGKAFLQEHARNAPFGRLETAEDIAAGVVYLASDEASHVTGCELNISGGRWV
jgi:NAD(P)-dependent dehydrogenase (short-subunit alcohol dehydrogenase family)